MLLPCVPVLEEGHKLGQFSSKVVSGLHPLGGSLQGFSVGSSRSSTSAHHGKQVLHGHQGLTGKLVDELLRGLLTEAPTQLRKCVL